MQKSLFFFLFIFFSTYVFSQDTAIFSKQLSTVTVRSAGKKTTEVSIINFVRNSSVVSDGLSAEFIKKTPDRNVGDVLKRVSGVTVQNDRFVLVRGLADRYNLGMLNKNLLPSTEPDRRSFSFDIIPSFLVDNVIVVKSASANNPSEWGGGLIQITTKEVSEKFFNVSLGSGLGTVSSLRKYSLVNKVSFPSSFPSTYKYRISSNGDKRLYTKQIENPIAKDVTSLPNLNTNLSFGTKVGNLSILFSSVVRNSYSASYSKRKDYQSSSELAYDYKDSSFTKRTSSSGLLNLTYLGKNRYSWKTLVNHQIEKSYLYRRGVNYDNVQDVMSNSSNHLTNTVINSQIDGKIKDFSVNLNYNFIFREQPDYRVNPITKSLNSSESFSTAWRDTYRFWSILDENTFGGNISQDIKKFKIGLGYLKRLRNFNARVFRYNSYDMLDEITNNTDKYVASFDLGNVYTMYETDFGHWKINAGIRTEYNLFNVKTADFSGQKINVSRRYIDPLPSMNLSYNQPKSKYRLSLSKTLARPEFREVAKFSYYDFVRNAQILGNPSLEKSDIYNFDLKWEVYPRSGENLSFSLFGKNFMRPIEQIVDQGSVPSNLLLTFANPKSAVLYGIEIEIRKKMCEWLDVYTNSSVMKSVVSVNSTKRRMQGQSDYAVNLGMNAKIKKTTFNVSYNRVGDRISAVGFQGYPDIFENGRDVVDLTYLKKIRNGEIKISVSDMLSQPSVYYQKIKDRNLIETNNEMIVSFSLNLNL